MVVLLSGSVTPVESGGELEGGGGRSVVEPPASLVATVVVQLAGAAANGLAPAFVLALPSASAAELLPTIRSMTSNASAGFEEGPSEPRSVMW